MDSFATTFDLFQDFDDSEHEKLGPVVTGAVITNKGSLTPNFK